MWQRAAPSVALAACLVTLAATTWRAIAARGIPAAGAVTVADTAVTVVAGPWTLAAGPWKVIYKAQMVAAVTRTLIARAWRLLHPLWRHSQSRWFSLQSCGEERKGVARSCKRWEAKSMAPWQERKPLWRNLKRPWHPRQVPCRLGAPPAISLGPKYRVAFLEGSASLSLVISLLTSRLTPLLARA